MDGPSVNWKLLSHFKSEVGAAPNSPQTLEIFNDSPARRTAFTLVTKNSKTFPNQFVGVRWLENRTVVEHLLSLLDDLKLFVDAVETKQV